ncbi:carboxylating nicotinate-nucleotide diphosphorylase [Hoeflea prorocentri]|uniref:Probable nicotinate-nucleotide pyrophosphorylase [carboxylating] n=1 Tax=Hoeflea prorocentri TaxID=1922333 RepID=A0A9X3ZI36_9HYPH|nr:carboxylating nicotinate-nucleotide diphosphorylase [Hoeflea prorocentri]MCY6381451.1 carboxylating nicotinate-nucleotide diphosphorylase [Hoeflea prorocentri]MDA5399251.1 carboxylating nicotinate-nucleotide diphosphorylase [Hoeflea prorocentri]
MNNALSLSSLHIERSVRNALEEDFGRAGDITSKATISQDVRASTVIAARESGIVAGLPLAAHAFKAMDSGASVELKFDDGDTVEAGATIAKIEGNARALLGAERVALNFLMHLSGVATLTSHYAKAIAHTKARVCCTRKTLPGLRVLEKYAVRCGGGVNHRFGLDDAVLIKDNHIAVSGGVGQAIRAAKAHNGHMVRIEVEVDTLDQLAEALEAGPDAVLLDNMPPAILAQAVEMNAGRAVLEASGGIDLTTIAAVAETGVDYISTSRITMAAPALDFGLDIHIG